MKDNILIKPTAEIDYYRALILSSGIHRLFLPMKFQFRKRERDVRVEEYFVNIDGYISLKEYLEHAGLEPWDIADMLLQLLEGIDESMYRYIFPFEYKIGIDNIYYSQSEKKFKLLFVPSCQHLKDMSNLSKLIIEHLDVMLTELAANVDEKSKQEIKALKRLIYESKSADDFARKLNVFKRNLWRSRQGKISRTIAL